MEKGVSAKPIGSRPASGLEPFAVRGGTIVLWSVILGDSEEAEQLASRIWLPDLVHKPFEHYS